MRRIGASILVVLAAILLLLSSYGWWANRYFLDSGRFATKADQILDQESVQEALALAITDEITKASGRDLQIARPFITTIVREVVQSDPFQKIFDAAVLRIHRAIVEGGARDAVLDLTDAIDRVKSALEPFAPNLADQIPEGEKVRVTVLDKTQLQTIYDATNLVKDVVIALTVATVLFFAGGIALSDRRWRTAALAGWVTLGLFVVSLVAVRTGRAVTGSLTDVDEYSAAAQDAYKVVTRGLVVQGVVFAVFGLVVALVTGWIDRNGGWAAVTDRFARARTWAAARAPKRAAPVPAGEPTPELATVAAGGAPAGDAAGTTAETAASTRAAVGGLLAPRLPEPPCKARAAHWWRAAGLLVLGLVAVFSPGSLVTVAVVLVGLAALYLALTEAVAAWGSPKEDPTPDASGSDTRTDGS